MLPNAHIPVAVFVWVAVMVMAGCSSTMLGDPAENALSDPPQGGTVTPGETGLLSVESEGKSISLFSLYRDASVLVFLNESCLAPESDAARALAETNDKVSVIEVAGPSEDCSAHNECVWARGDKLPNLVSLCDPNGLLRGWYEIATPTAVIVLNRTGAVEASGSLEDLGCYCIMAEDLARQETEEPSAPSSQ